MAAFLRRAPLACLLASGCGPDLQSPMTPGGPHADTVATLSWMLFGGGGAILALVVVMTALAIFLPHERRGWMARSAFILWLGIAFPAATLTALLGYGLLVSRDLRGAPASPLRIEVVGEQWWWRVHYLEEDGSVLFATANEIHIPVGRPVEFSLKTADVIHSFWVPNLAGKLDMIPGRTNVYRFAAYEPGIYRGQCAEYCGAQHALMAFFVVATQPDEFAVWREGQTAPAREPPTPFAARGRDVFLAYGCGACHAVRGTSANGVLGPDLTHFGSRLSIAAGTFPNSIGALAGWIASAQHLKPDNRMPSFNNLEGDELRAVAAYLESLE